MERRATARDRLSLPIALPNGEQGKTRDVSAGGMYITVPAGSSVESWLRIEFSVPSAGLRFSAAGEVVRVEHGADEDGVALRLHMSRLTTIE